jgi:hypothetical protein
MLVTYPRHWTCTNATILTVSVVIIAGYGNMYNVAHCSGTTNACAIGSLIHPFRPGNHSLILGYGSPSTLRAFLFSSLPRRFFLSSWLSLCSCTTLPHGHNTFRMLCYVNVNVQECAVREHWVSRLAVDRCNVRSRSTYRWQQIQHQAAVCAHVS